MRKIPLFLALALAVPSLAFAAKPPAKPQQANGKGTPQVMYVLKGTITAFTAASGTTNGSVSLLVKSANHHGVSLKGQTLTFAVSSSTKVVTEGGAAVAVNDNGLVQVRGPKKIPATDTLAATLQAATARHVVDQGASS